MDCLKTTLAYYSHWLGAPPEAAQSVFLPARDESVPGYSAPFHLYIFAAPGYTALSYGLRARPGIHALLPRLAAGMEEAIVQPYGISPGHSVKFFLRAAPSSPSIPARALTLTDEAAYLSFFAQANGCSADDWVSEYFGDMVQDGMCFGVFENGILASCTDGPTMPFMANAVREIGIHTLPAFRGRGYARAACAACIHSLLSRNFCPIWSAGAENIASRRLAESLGFAPLADVYTLSLP